MFETLRINSLDSSHERESLGSLVAVTPLNAQYSGSDAGFFHNPFFSYVPLSPAADLGWSSSLISSKKFPPRLLLGCQALEGVGSVLKELKNFSASFQIQISQLSGKTVLQWVCSSDLVQNLKANLERRIGIPSAIQRLLF